MEFTQNDLPSVTVSVPANGELLRDEERQKLADDLATRAARLAYETAFESGSATARVIEVRFVVEVKPRSDFDPAM